MLRHDRVGMQDGRLGDASLPQESAHKVVMKPTRERVPPFRISP
jgi:hypothetical protein